MAIRKELKDSENYQLVAGLDEDGAAQELSFDDDRVKVSANGEVGDGSLVSLLHGIGSSIKEYSELMLIELKIMNIHLSIITGNEIGEDDGN
jgi:hypothetical protein